MEYYHAFVKLKEPQIFEVWSNLSEKTVRQQIAAPFNAKKSLSFGDSIISYSQIITIGIFVSKKEYADIVLPDGKKAIDEAVDKVYKLFRKSQVDDVFCRTTDFILPQRKMNS